jgi:hypothetical protein
VHAAIDEVVDKVLNEAAEKVLKEDLGITSQA